LLLFGGAIQLAGEVKARSERRRARSDLMAVERAFRRWWASSVRGAPSTSSTRRSTRISLMRSCR